MGNWDWGMDDVMPGSNGLGILVIFEKAVSWDLTLDEASWDSDLGESSWVYGICRAFVGSVSWDLKLDEASPVCSLRDAPRVCWIKWNGHHSKNCVSLSSCRKTKSQEVNKRFVPERKKVVSVSGFLCIWWIFFFFFVVALGVLGLKSPGKCPNTAKKKKKKNSVLLKVWQKYLNPGL